MFVIWNLNYFEKNAKMMVNLMNCFISIQNEKKKKTVNYLDTFFSRLLWVTKSDPYVWLLDLLSNGFF